MLLPKRNKKGMSISAFIIRASVWKKSKNLSTVEWINKSWNTHTKEHNTAMKTIELQLHKINSIDELHNVE